MKKLLVCFQALTVVLILSSCDGPKKSNTQNAAPRSEEATEANTESNNGTTGEMAKDVQSKKEKRMGEHILGSTLIDNMVKNMTQKLTLKDGQVQSLKDILSTGLTSSGNSLEKEYNFEEAKKIRSEILHSSSDKIMPLLDGNQQETFKGFLNH